MSLTVRDIMNPQLLYASGDESPLAVRAKLVHFAVSGAPVLDRAYRPVGFVSLRDFSADGATMKISQPAVTTLDDVPIESAARALSDANLRHLVVVNAAGRAVGVLSAIDLVRAFAGVPARHPARFDVDCSSGGAFPDG